jgi:hypothetical protein
MGVACLAVPPHATAAVPTTSTGSVAGFYYDGMGGQSAYFKLTGTLSFGTETRTGRWFITDDLVNAQLRDSSTDAQIGTCVVNDTVWLGLDEPAAASITCLGHFDGQGRDFPVTLVLAMPDVKPADYYHGTGYEYDGVYAG